MAEFTWSICKALNSQLIDKFKSMMWLNEKDVNAEGFIQNIEDCNYEKQDLYLSLYMNHNKQAYDKYWKNIIGQYRDDVPRTSYYIKQYIQENDLQLDFNKFIVEKKHLFYQVKDKNVIIQQIVNKVVGPIFDESKFLNIYVYRDRDHKGLLATRINTISEISTDQLSE